MAYAQWYMAYMRERQMGNWRLGGGGPMGAWGQGGGMEWNGGDRSGLHVYQGVRGMPGQSHGSNGHIVPPMTQMGPMNGHQPVLVYNTR